MLTPKEEAHEALHDKVELAVADLLDDAFEHHECGADVLARMLCMYITEPSADEEHVEELLAMVVSAGIMRGLMHMPVAGHA